jgi:hypothetical protein
VTSKPAASQYIDQVHTSFQTAYSGQRYDEAVAIFSNALSVDPEATVRYFISHASGQLAEALVESDSVDSIAPRLDSLIAEHPSINLICPNEAVTINRLLRLREDNIQKGLPSPVLITMGNSASVVIANIFNSGFKLPSFAYSLINVKVLDAWARDYGRGGACYVTQLKPSLDAVQRLKAAGISKIIVHTRDPRQALVSLVHHFEMYPEQIAKGREAATGDGSVSERAMALLPYYSNFVQWITGWLALEGDIDILFSTFEDFVADRTAFVETYLDFYRVNPTHFSWGHAFGEHVGVDHHFRSGKIDEWKEVFSEKEADYLSSLMPPRVKARFGWSDRGQPTREEHHRLLSVAWPSPRGRFMAWLYDGDVRADETGLDEVRRRRMTGDFDPPPELEEMAVRARLRDFPDHGVLLMRLCTMMEARGEVLPGGLAIHALRSRLT